MLASDDSSKGVKDWKHNGIDFLHHIQVYACSNKSDSQVLSAGPNERQLITEDITSRSSKREHSIKITFGR